MNWTLQDRYGGTALTEEEQHQVKEEFDFEGNNAMFDKVLHLINTENINEYPYLGTINKYAVQAAEMAEIEAELGNKPDIVRLVHTNR